MIEQLLNTPCHIIDFLPQQVPENSPGQFFAVEAYFLRPPRYTELRRSFLELLLRVNCYADFHVSTPDQDTVLRNPSPDELSAWILPNQKDLCILLPDEHALFTLNRDDTYMTVYHASARLLELLGQLTSACGLFLRGPVQP